MIELLTAAQMRAVEMTSIKSGEVTGLQLMERAGCAVVDSIFEFWPELASSSFRAVILCGPGNNGGDGFVVARLLREWGWVVNVFLYGDHTKLPPDASKNFELWHTLGEVRDTDIHDPIDDVREADLVIDAVFGTGLTRLVEGKLAGQLEQLIEVCGTLGKHVVSIDLPTGLCSDSGKAMGAVVKADLTVTFHSAKLGHKLGMGASYSGKLAVKPIGLEDKVQYHENGEQRSPAVPLVETVHLVEKPTLPGKKSGDHKFNHGHALIISGGMGKTGAARLAARGALRIGAGLVTLGVPPSAQAEVACQITALMMDRIEGKKDLIAMLEDDRLTALCLGPGLGLERARELVPVVLGARNIKPRRTVLDADALSAFADAPEDLFRQLHEDCILTPHAGEFRNLFPDIYQSLIAPPTTESACSKVDATRRAAKRAGCTVLFKGADTVISTPSGSCCLHAAQSERCAPCLATAGSGDVLAGFITGLLAMGVPPLQAAKSAVWIHVQSALTFGPGLIAEDIPEILPTVFREWADD